MPKRVAGAFDVKQVATPATNPSSGSNYFYVKSDGKIYTKDNGGTEVLVGSNATDIISGTLAIARGGTNGSATPTNGGAVYGTGTAYAVTAAGTTQQALISNGAAAPTWNTLDMSYLPDSTFKKSVKAATTANITLSGTQTVDGIALVALDRCLVKDQTLSQNNGIYVVAAGAWTRVTDADTASEIAASVVGVDSGTANGGTQWATTFKTTDTLGTTAMLWSTFVTGASSATLTNKTINLTSNTLTGTTAQFNTALSDNDFATIAGTEILTNKTLTTPTVNTTLTVSHASGNAAIEVGRQDNVASTPIIDFHSGATSIDYDSRLFASGGTGTNGQGNLDVISLFFTHNSLPVATTTGTQTLSSKTLTTPTIVAAGWTNANHAHDGATTGGQLNAANVFNAGLLPIARGGTNSSATPTLGGVVYGDGSAHQVTAAGTSGQTLQSNGAAAPTWVTPAAGTPTAFKQSVKAATVSAITLSGTQTVDGVALVATDRCLVKNQASSQTNGIYVVAAGAWTRATDADTAAEVAGATVSVDAGTQMGGLVWFTNFKSTDTLGTTAMPWGQFDTAVSSATFSNKTINLSNNTLSGTTALFNAALSDNDFATIAGTETLTSKTLNNATVTNGISLSSGTIKSPDGIARIGVATGSGSEVNYLEVAGGDTGARPSLAVVGTDTNIDLNLISKGSGKVMANAVEVVTLTGSQFLSNKVLTTPKIGVIKDPTNSGDVSTFEGVASNANYLRVINSAAGNPVSIGVAGSDTNINLELFSKGGTGAITINGSAALSLVNAGTVTNKKLSTGTTIGASSIDVSGAWTAYTPTTSGVTLGTGGTITGAYVQMGKTIDYRITLTLGTAGVFTGTCILGLPVAAVVRTSRTPMGQALCFDNSATAYYVRTAGYNSTTAVLFIDAAAALVAASAPFVWAVNDKLEVTGTYEAA